MFLRSTAQRSAVAAACVVGTVLGFTGQSYGSTGGRWISAQASPSDQPFAEQVRAANLSSEQATLLQSEVDGHLRKLGGRQVSPNEIRFDRGRILVAIPGENHPRDFATGRGTQFFYDQCLDGDIPSGWFCEYNAEYFQGSQVQWYKCDTYTDPFNGLGSWVNNQSPGTRARMYNVFGTPIYTTPGAYSVDATGNWYDVQSVKIC
ncbi:hypothetical protein [Streptomyces sp. GbtcB7]|uniref:hypothetical protein n=1 Tax=Streptomyces sp. GbtcB7 TaxID=2824752 RepID=UPI001C310EC0|nr:hypothetical protein [Streptomyces sp. GbtcB7]